VSGKAPGGQAANEAGIWLADLDHIRFIAPMTWIVGKLDALSAYPRWFVVPCLILAGLGILWFLAKVLKWSLWILVAVVMIGMGVLLILGWMG
jgi:hypothetical protein